MKWHAVAKESDFDESNIVGVKIAGQEIVLCRFNAEIHAVQGICTHGHARLEDGYLEDNVIECPLHQGRFDVCTGRALGAPVSIDLKVFKTMVKDGDVLVELE